MDGSRQQATGYRLHQVNQHTRDSEREKRERENTHKTLMTIVMSAGERLNASFPLAFRKRRNFSQSHSR